MGLKAAGLVVSKLVEWRLKVVVRSQSMDGYGIDGAENDGIENKGVELAVGGVNIGSIGGLQLRVLTAKRTTEMTE
jgi:hypothetical protein